MSLPVYLQERKELGWFLIRPEATGYGTCILLEMLKMKGTRWKENCGHFRLW